MTAKTNAAIACEVVDRMVRQVIDDDKAPSELEQANMILLVQEALDEKDLEAMSPTQKLDALIHAAGLKVTIDPSRITLNPSGVPTPAITKSDWEKTENIGNQCAGPEDIEPGVRKQLGKPTPASPTQATGEHCPVCGARVRIVGETTMSYEPVCACAEASIADCPVHHGLQDEATTQAAGELSESCKMRKATEALQRVIGFLDGKTGDSIPSVLTECCTALYALRAAKANGQYPDQKPPVLDKELTITAQATGEPDVDKLAEQWRIKQPSGFEAEYSGTTPSLNSAFKAGYRAARARGGQEIPVTIECCHMCEAPKVSGGQWGKCPNKDCVAFDQPMASCCYRPFVRVGK